MQNLDKLGSIGLFVNNEFQLYFLDLNSSRRGDPTIDPPKYAQSWQWQHKLIGNCTNKNRSKLRFEGRCLQRQYLHARGTSFGIFQQK
jgi:hypothetical protein